jgi:broad specificity phosphatase PhoE
MPGKQFDDQADDYARGNMQNVLFIRHGESEAHIGKAATHIEEVGLTLSGKEKALEIARSLSRVPDLIIVSPYLRAWQTASPTMQRFHDTPSIIWQDVREFTYLGSLAGQCLTKQERSGMVNSFWGRCDPDYKDGNGESFSQFIWRARRALARLRQMEGFIVVFTHEQFIRLVQCVLLEWAEDADVTPEQMQRFREMLLRDPLPYGYVDDVSWHQHRIQALPVLAPAPLSALS